MHVLEAALFAQMIDKQGRKAAICDTRPERPCATLRRGAWWRMIAALESFPSW